LKARVASSIGLGVNRFRKAIFEVSPWQKSILVLLSIVTRVSNWMRAQDWFVFPSGKP